MISSFKKIITVLILVVTFTSCNQGETLQSYFVANQETPDFMSVDLPTSFVKVDKTNFTEVQKEAYKSIDKLNTLLFTVNDSNKETYQEELVKVKAILADEKYEELFRGTTAEGKVLIKYIGTDNSIDELIIFGTASDKGFGIIRVLGDDMEPNKIITLGDALKNANFEETQLQEFSNFFK
jgi:hypothetical protein